MPLVIIILVIIICGAYDFAVWYGIFKEQSGHQKEKLYRILKELTDIIILPLVCLLWFGWNIDALFTFYLIKWFGGSDGVYIFLWKLFNAYKHYTQEGLWWLWWTPLGMIRTQLIYKADTLTLNPNEVIDVFGNWFLLKGKLTFNEFKIQLVIGVIISFLFYHFSVASWIWMKCIEPLWKEIIIILGL